MRDKLNKLNINGEIVIGEGELDEAPMVYIGEKRVRAEYLSPSKILIVLD